MAIVRDGNRSVLMVVDVQAGVVRGAWEAERVVGNVARAVEKARTQGVPVIWVQHSDEDLPHGSPEWQWAAGLDPRADEVLIEKHFNSAFEETPLEATLARLGATEIVLAGCATNWCIRASAYAALERGYDLTLVRDAHTTKTMTLDDGTRIEAARLIDDLNIAMRYLGYPGRTNAAVAVGDLKFSGSTEA